MQADLFDLLKGVATAALIGITVRWLITAKGPDFPKFDGDVAAYGIKWQVRSVAYAASALCIILTFVDLRAGLGGGRWPVNFLFAAFALGAAWFGTGVVTTDQKTISKRTLWHSSSLKWDEISEVRLHKRDGGAIELRGDGRKLIVDSRFIAQAHLRSEVEHRTNLQPLSD